MCSGRREQKLLPAKDFVDLARTVTSHLWLENGTSAAASGSGAVGGADPTSPEASDGCGCTMPRTGGGAWAALVAAALCALALRRRAGL